MTIELNTTTSICSKPIRNQIRTAFKSGYKMDNINFKYGFVSTPETIDLVEAKIKEVKADIEFHCTNEKDVKNLEVVKDFLEPESELKSSVEKAHSLFKEGVFPNGFIHWLETHHEFVSFLSVGRMEDLPFAEILNEEGGTGRFYEVAKEWTDEFELKFYNNQWGEVDIYYDELEKFFEMKTKQILIQNLDYEK